MIALRETVQFMCVMKIKGNTQRIHTVKQIHKKNLGLECDNIILGDIYQNIDEYQNIPNIQTVG